LLYGYVKNFFCPSPNFFTPSPLEGEGEGGERATGNYFFSISRNSLFSTFRFGLRGNSSTNFTALMTL